MSHRHCLPCWASGLTLQEVEYLSRPGTGHRSHWVHSSWEQQEWFWAVSLQRPQFHQPRCNALSLYRVSRPLRSGSGSGTKVTSGSLAFHVPPTCPSLHISPRSSCLHHPPRFKMETAILFSKSASWRTQKNTMMKE